jgi:K+-sensing histidine kinase KdpD
MINIHQSSEAVYALLENLLAWSRLQRGLLRYQPQEWSVCTLAEETLVLFRSQAEQSRLP